MDNALNTLIFECEESLKLLRDYIEMKWGDWDKEWAQDKVNNAITCIRCLLREENNEC